jgi:hypothetical protein
MKETKTVRNITEWNPIGMRSKGLPKIEGQMRC